MKILYRTITANTQVSTQQCWLVGVEVSHTTNTTLVVYDEDDSSKTAAKKVSTIKCTSFIRENSIVFPEKGVLCKGIYAV